MGYFLSIWFPLPTPQSSIAASSLEVEPMHFWLPLVVTSRGGCGCLPIFRRSAFFRNRPLATGLATPSAHHCTGACSNLSCGRFIFASHRGGSHSIPCYGVCLRRCRTFCGEFYRSASGSFLLCRKALVVKCGVSAEGVQRVWWAPLNQTSGLQGHSGGGWGDLAGDDLGTGSGWKKSRQNQTPLCSDETRSSSTSANLHAALAAPLHLSSAQASRASYGALCSMSRGGARWPNG